MSLPIRAVLTDPDAQFEQLKAGKLVPVEALFRDTNQAKAWADRVLASAGEGSFVTVYQTEETTVGFFRKAKAAGETA